MWPYTKEERDWLDRSTGEPAAPEIPEITPQMVAAYIAKGRRLRSEAFAEMLRAAARAVSRGFGRLTGASAPAPAAADDVVTDIAHRLKTPLTSIKSLSEILRHNPDVPLEERNRFLDVIVQESDRLDRSVNQILAAVSAATEPMVPAAARGPRRAPERASTGA